MADLDELRIRINADSSNAQRSIDGLVQRLGRLSNSLGTLNVSGLDDLTRGVTNLNTAMNGLGGQANDSKAYRSLANNLRRLGNLNAAQIGGIGTSIRSLTTSLQNLSTINVNDSALRITELARSISRLGGANANNAVQTIPLLANALRQMVTTLATAPQVSRNLIELTNALANLAAQSRNVRNASGNINTNFARIGHTARNIRPHIHGLASAFGRFYASCFLAIRAVKGLWSAIGKAMNYIEVLNYFNAAMEQIVSKADLSAWEELGYESAQAYAESFSNAILEVSEKMTGYTQDVTGRLVQINGAKSLGINATQLMNASTNFTQIASSMGVASDNAVKLSNVLTELGADLASVKNLDFESVWQNLQSGMVGMSRAVDKYGINLRNANLQAELTNIGIQTSVANLGQEEKALLRVITMLNSTEFAYGDLADTIQQPANQVRILKASFENLARSIGNIFLPIVARVIPYITTLVNALTRLNEYIVEMLGFAGFDWGASSSMSDVVSDALDAEDALEGASGAADKLKKSLQGFDELNNLTTSSDSGSGGLVSAEDLAKLQEAFDAAVEKYQQRWDEAFANMAETYNSFADDVANAFKEGGMYGVGKYLSDSLADALNGIDWEEIRSKTNAFASGVAGFINGFVNPETLTATASTFAEVINTIVESLYTLGIGIDWENLGDSAEAGLEAFFGTVNWARLAQTLNVWVQGFAKAISKIVKNTEFWKTAFSGLGEFFSNLDVSTVGLIIGAVSIVRGANLLTGAIQNVLGRVGVQVALVITAAIVGYEFGNQLGIWLSEAFGDEDTKDLYINFHWTGEGGFFDTLFADDSFGSWIESYFGAGEELYKGLFDGNGMDWISWLFMGINPGSFYFLEEAFFDTELWEDYIKPDLEQIRTNIEAFFSGDMQDVSFDFKIPIIQEFADMGIAISEDIDQLENNIKAFFKGDWLSIDMDFNTKFFQFFADIGMTWGEKLNELQTDFEDWWQGILDTLNEWFTTIKNALWGDDSIWMSIMYWWSDTVKPFFRDAGTSIWEIIKGNLNNLIDGFENFCNKVIDGIDAMIGQIVGSFKIDLPDYVNNTMGIPDITVGAGKPLHVQFNRLAEGGIATSSTIANIGEAGKEAVLPLERNTGWMDSLAERLVASMNQQGGGGTYTFVAELDGNTLFEETVRQNDMWRNQTGRNAFA